MSEDSDRRIADIERELKELRWLFNALRDELLHFIDGLRKR